MNNEICQDFLSINMNVPKICGSERLKAHEHKLQYIFKGVEIHKTKIIFVYLSDGRAINPE